MKEDWFKTYGRFARGGARNGTFLEKYDLIYTLANALGISSYQKVNPNAIAHKLEHDYIDNASFWKDALLCKHFPGSYIILNDFHLLEWLPFSPGRYFTEAAKILRKNAELHFDSQRNEYNPVGKGSMVRGGIGAIRLAEKIIGDRCIFFLGASSTGIAHEGIPIALPYEEYSKVMPIIREKGGCQVKLAGSLQTMTENFPLLDFDQNIPRYCLFAEEVTVKKPSIHCQLLTTVAIMFKANNPYSNIDKSWTFCSFHPGSLRSEESTGAVDWLLNYARKYSDDNPIILTDFDEHYNFPCRVEFPISDIVRGKVDWNTLNVYKQRYQGTYIENYFNHIETIYDQSINKQRDVNMTDNRIINMGDRGNYIERNEGDYVQNNKYSGQPQTLAEAAAEIQILLQQLEKTYPTTTTSEKMVVAAQAVTQIETNPLLKQRVINALKEGSLAAFEKAIDNPVAAFVVHAIQGWHEVRKD